MLNYLRNYLVIEQWVEEKKETLDLDKELG